MDVDVGLYVEVGDGWVWDVGEYVGDGVVECE